MSEVREVAIAGAGVAGLAFAVLAARSGRRVVVYEQASQLAPVGSGLILQPVGLTVLGVLGLEAEMRSLGAPIRELSGRLAPAGRRVLNARYGTIAHPDRSGLGVHRAALHGVLLRTATVEGVSFETDRRVETIGNDGRIRFAGGRMAPRSDLTVDALGVHSPLTAGAKTLLSFGALWANAPVVPGFLPDGLDQRYRGASRMAGVMPIGRIDPGGQQQLAFFWSMKRSDYPRFAASTIESWRDEVVEFWPQTRALLETVKDRSELVFASYAHGLAPPRKRGPVVSIGDSWHSASPQLGQGANMALLDALALSQSLAGAGSLADQLRRYWRARRGHVALYQMLSSVLTPLYQSDSASLSFVRDHILAPLSALAPAQAILSRMISGRLIAPLSGPSREATRLFTGAQRE